jgi:hypothetical protein
MGGFVLISIVMTFCVILGLFILGGLALYVLKMRIYGARFSVAQLRETIFVFFVLFWDDFPCCLGEEMRGGPSQRLDFQSFRVFILFLQISQLFNEYPYLLVDKYVQG